MKQLSIFYAAGPGDVIGTFHHWKAGRDDPRETSLTYSGQFYALCAALDARALVIAQRPGGRVLCDGNFTLRERATPFQQSASAILFHLGQILGGLRLIFAALAFRASVAIVAEGTHWFMLALLRLVGVRVIPDIQCALWPTGNPPATFGKKLVMRLNAFFFRHFADRALCISPQCERQIGELTGGRGRMFATRPTYRAEGFGEVAPPKPSSPFCLFFAGRLQENKGIFDLVAMMETLELSHPGAFRCVVCGTGPDEAQLAARIREAGLEPRIHLAGQLHRRALLAELSRSHAVIVPTTQAFAEGFTRVVIEGVLAGRPVIATTVCNAGDVLEEALVEVAPGDVAALAAAAVRLAKDHAYYSQRQEACEHLSRQFYDPEVSWGAGLRRAIESALPSLAQPRRVRILYAAGPGDVAGTYRFWKEGVPDPREVAFTYSGQFYSTCRRLGLTAKVLAQGEHAGGIQDGFVSIKHVPTWFAGSSNALLFHAGQFLGGIRLAWSAWRFHADIAVISSGTHWFLLVPLHWMGVKIIPTLHCTLWASGQPPASRFRRLIQRLNGWFFRTIPVASICISPECERQIRQISQGQARNLLPARALYADSIFQGISHPRGGRKPFTLLFAGRLTRDKGIYDLLAVAEALQSVSPEQFQFLICGEGPERPLLARQAAERGLESVFRILGKQERASLLEHLAKAHVVIAPTTRAFTEGLNKSIIEAILARRPAIATTVCNAGELLGPAIIEVPPGDIAAMAQAIVSLQSDPEFYVSKQAACAMIAKPFLDPASSWGAALQRAIQITVNIKPEARPETVHRAAAAVEIEPPVLAGATSV